MKLFGFEIDIFGFYQIKHIIQSFDPLAWIALVIIAIGIYVMPRKAAKKVPKPKEKN